MRVHGDKVISRCQDVQYCSDYHDYLPNLRKDFHFMCGYCGKTEVASKNAFEIDHFVPRKYAEKRKNDYQNLVYSCHVCNHKKWSKWPSKDADVQFQDNKGFVDPASEDFDKHLERLENGIIIGKTELGNYMAEEAFEFHLRPIREVWKVMQLIEKKKLLREKIKTFGAKEIQEYIEMDALLETLQEMLFDKKE